MDNTKFQEEKEMIHICPRCNQRFVVSPCNIDYVHECNSGSDVLDQEDVLVVGTYTENGVTTSAMAGDVAHAGATNKLWGSRAAIEGNVLQELTSRGNAKIIYRQRQKEQYIEVNNHARK
jgi:general stress protein 26